jgi:hypothetical protein
MRVASIVLLGVVIVCTPGLHAEDKRAKTSDGKEVILREDGTWSYVGEYQKSNKATEVHKGKRGTYTLSLVPGVWKKEEKKEGDQEFIFSHKDGEMWAFVTAERIEMPEETLKKAALENLRTIDKDAKIVLDEKRTVNGKKILCLVINAKVEGIKYTFVGYYYSGDEGTFQIVAYTAEKLFKELTPELEGFVNGFELVKKKD